MDFQQSWRSSLRCWAVVCFAFTQRSNSSHLIWVWCLPRPGHVTQPIIPHVAFRCVFGAHCPVKMKMLVPLSTNQMGWHVTAECRGYRCLLRTSWILTKSPTSKAPHNITPPPLCFMVGTAHIESIRSPFLRLTKTKVQIPTGLMSIAFVFGPTKSLLLLLPQYCRLCSDQCMRPCAHGLMHWSLRRTLSPLNSWFQDVSAAWTLRSIYVDSNLRFVRLVVNLSSAAEVTLGVSVLRRSSWEPVSSQRLMIFATNIEGGYIQGSWNLPDWLTFLF